MNRSPSLYELVIQKSREYIGPAAERFIQRQITTHLGITPQTLTRNDLIELIDWVKPTFSLLTQDQERIEAYVNDLYEIANGKTSSLHSKRIA